MSRRKQARENVDAGVDDFVVNVSSDGNADKTFDQIREAVLDGKRVIAHLVEGGPHGSFDYLLPLAGYGGQSLAFSITTGGSAIVVQCDSDSWTVKRYSALTKDNVQTSLTAAGTILNYPPSVDAVKEYVDDGKTVVDDGNGNLTMDGATAQTALRYLQSLTVPGLNFKYINPMHGGTISDPYGLHIGSGVSLIDTINTLTEPGLYTVYQNRASTDVPDGAKAINSSLRGLACLSQIEKHYAFILMVDQASNFYVQYIQDDVGGGWKQMPDPGTGGAKECTLQSTTPNSTKKFKITVDDSGALSAVEVTE